MKEKEQVEEYTFILFLILSERKNSFQKPNSKNQGFHCAVGSVKEVGKRLCAVH